MTSKAKLSAPTFLLACLFGTGIVPFAISTAHAALVGGSAVGPIQHYYSYSDFGIGDVVIRVSTPPPTCPGGFWVRMTDPGAKNVVAQLLTAVAAQIPLIIWGYDDQLWPGTTTATCRLYTVDYAL
jgi:hypothetical protein